MRTFVLGLSLAMLISFTAQNGWADKNESKKGEYASIQVCSFTVKKNLEVPPEFITRLQKNLPSQLTGTKRFKHVYNFEDPSTDPGGPALQMAVTVIEYDSGSRAKRYLVGFGAGTAEAVAHVKLVKTGTDEIVFERDVTAKMSGGAFGGSSNTLADQLAKEIAKVTKRAYF